MPYVTVVFDPTKISQETVNQLKSQLQLMAAKVLSNPDTLDIPITPEVSLELEMGVLKTSPEEIMVMQHAAHPTDINVPALEVYIQAGRPKNRSGDKIVELLGVLVAESGLIPEEHLGDGLSGIFITFHENNGFGFIPRRS